MLISANESMPAIQEPSLFEQDTAEIESQTEREITRLRGAKAIYKETHPEPKKKKLSFFRVMGIDAIATAASSLGGLGLAAIRTATVFWISEAALVGTYKILGLQGTWFFTVAMPALSMVFALAGVEGTLFSKGLKHGRQVIQSKWAVWDLVFAFAISLIANLEASSALVTNINPVIANVLAWALVLITGLGATVLAYYGAESFGSIFKDWEMLQEKNDKEFEAKLDVWMQKAQGQYSSRIGQRVFGVDNSPEKAQDQIKRTETEKEVVRKWLEANNITANQVGVGAQYVFEPKQVAKETGIKPENVRTILLRIKRDVNLEQPKG